MASEESVTLDTLFKNKTPHPKTITTSAPMPKKHGSLKAGITEAFSGRELTVNQVIEKLRVKEPKLSEGSVRSTVALMRKQGLLSVTRKEGREPFLTLSNGETQTQKVARVATATGGLAADLAALEAALRTIRGMEPVLARLKSRLEKLSEVL